MHFDQTDDKYYFKLINTLISMPCSFETEPHYDP